MNVMKKNEVCESGVPYLTKTAKLIYR